MVRRRHHRCEGEAAVFRSRPARAGTDEHGAALVELLILLPLLFMIIFGGVSAAISYNRKLDVTHAAREGARYGAALPELQCTPTSNCNGHNWAQHVQAVVVERSDGTLTAAQVCISLVKGATGVPVGASFTTKGDGTSCFDDGNGDAGKRVQVSTRRTGDSINAVFVRVPVTLASDATARFEE
jgi:Flp pilus assembly protein TadG